MNPNSKTIELLHHLARKPGHDEVKADFRQILVEEFDVELSSLEFERRVPEVKGRLDALIGRTVFEAKSDLDREWPDVERRMPDYLADREREEGEKFVGLASDGRRWAVFELQGGKCVKVKQTDLDPDKPEAFLAWLDGVIALKSSLPPDPLTVRIELGQDSIAFRRAYEKLKLLWEMLKHDPAVSLKRQLWQQLLKLVYGRHVENDSLWFQHTFLVVVAKSIALAVLDMREDDPKRLLSGEALRAANIMGAVESDFFDWVIAVPEGEDLVRRIIAHVRRFRLQEVESDVLKILYESLIDRDERHGLGEYYTPDWLAAKVVRQAVDRPTEQKVLDPACGSGTFLFHAVRRFVAEAEDGDMKPEMWADEACKHVMGTDIHPVAVIIARVTYLLALAPALAKRVGAISIPVFLGDAMQLSISEMIGGKELTIRVPPPPAGEGRSGEIDGNGREQLDFPDTFCRDPGLFDKAIERMRTGSEAGMTRPQIERALTQITREYYKREITEEEMHAITDLGKTYVTFDRLRREGRDSVWAYVARNLSRPLALSSGGGWANVLVGNPPWVAFRHMSEDLQKRFKELAKQELVYVGGKLATQNDLCALFTVRAVALYLRGAGRIGFVLPMAVLSRGQFDRLRSGAYHSARVHWDEVWTMDESVYPLFPVPACAVFGRRRNASHPLPSTVRAYSGSLPIRDAPEDIADKRLRVAEDVPAQQVASFEGGSIYRKKFRNGATLFPRSLCLVERSPVGRLGGDKSMPLVRSRRNSLEKKPWKTLPGIENKVEVEFLRSVLLGESILPYRVFQAFEGVVPATAQGEVLDSQKAGHLGFDGLNGWMVSAERAWNGDRPAEKSLAQQFDYYGKLGAQFPISPLRVVYAKAGTQPAACIVRDRDSVIDHKLYWMALESEPEAQFLVAVLNSETARSRTEARQSRGLFGARDFDKVIFSLPIPRFDAANPLHQQLANISAEAEARTALIDLPVGVKFQRARKLVRDTLIGEGFSARIDALVAQLLDGV